MGNGNIFNYIPGVSSIEGGNVMQDIESKEFPGRYNEAAVVVRVQRDEGATGDQTKRICTHKFLCFFKQPFQV